MKMIAIRRIGILVWLLAAPLGAQQNSARVPRYSCKVIRQFPHDSTAFTQGLSYRDGYLYEGTGLNGRSSVRKVKLETGAVMQRVDLPSEYFGEGIALLDDKIFELTWKAGIALVYDAKSFQKLRQFTYSGEGWGLTTNGRELYMSDGSEFLRVLDPETFKEKRRIRVHDGAKVVRELNELEWVEGQIFANVWQTDRIVRISPQTGAVVGWVDCPGLLSPVYRRDPEAVLNGIAYDPVEKRLFVTGKLWPEVFEVRVVGK